MYPARSTVSAITKKRSEKFGVRSVARHDVVNGACLPRDGHEPANLLGQIRVPGLQRRDGADASTSTVASIARVVLSAHLGEAPSLGRDGRCTPTQVRETPKPRRACRPMSSTDQEAQGCTPRPHGPHGAGPGHGPRRPPVDQSCPCSSPLVQMRCPIEHSEPPRTDEAPRGQSPCIRTHTEARKSTRNSVASSTHRDLATSSACAILGCQVERVREHAAERAPNERILNRRKQFLDALRFGEAANRTEPDARERPSSPQFEGLGEVEIASWRD